MRIFHELNNGVLVSKDLIDDYWLFNDGTFVYKLDTLAEKYGLSPKEIRSAISSVYTTIDFGNCAGCSYKNVEAVETRSRAMQIIDNVYHHHFCETCREKAKDFCKKMSEEEKKIIWMRLSFKYKLWTRLDNDEINFLKALYYLRSWNRIYHEIMQLDLNNHFKLLFKLDKMHLIYYDKCEATGQIRIKIMKELKDLIQRKVI